MDIAGGTHQLLLDHMLLEVSRPVRRQATWTAAVAQLHRAFEMAKFDAESRQRGEGVDDEPTAVAGVVVTFVGVWLHLDRAVDADVVRQLPT